MELSKRERQRMGEINKSKRRKREREVGRKLGLRRSVQRMRE